MRTIIKFVVAILIVIAIMVIGVVACTSSVINDVDKEMKKSEEVTVGDDSKKSDSKDKKEEKKAKDLKFGDTFSVGKLQITVSKPVNKDAGEYDSADSGNMIVFDIVAKNNSSEQVFVDTTDFNLYDKNGEQIPEAYADDDYGINGEINAGRTLKGKLYFDAKPGQDLELVFSPTLSWTDVEVILKGKN